MRNQGGFAIISAAILAVTACILSACGGGGSGGGSGGSGGGASSSASTSSAASSSSSSASSSITDLPRSAEVPAGYNLVWSDEFDGAGLPDQTKWSDDTVANTYDPGNGELQYYTQARTQNEHMDSGYLYITAIREDRTGDPNYAGQHYSSARLITQNKASWKYSYFEIRAKLPCGAGAWPAIWMLGVGNNWPASGETDIMEQLGKDPNTIYGTVHDTFNQSHNGDGNHTTAANACTTFHNYELTWTTEQMQIAVDGVVYDTYVNAHTGTDQWPFDQAQYMILNLAMGGSWAGPVNDSALPESMVVDYVRVYQKP